MVPVVKRHRSSPQGLWGQRRKPSEVKEVHTLSLVSLLAALTSGEKTLEEKQYGWGWRGAFPVSMGRYARYNQRGVAVGQSHRLFQEWVYFITY